MLLVENKRSLIQEVSLDAFLWCIFIFRVLETSKLKAQELKECYNPRNSQLNTPDLPLLHLPK